MAETIEQQVMTTIGESLGIGETQVTPDASLVNDLGADSLDMVEVVMALEEQFDIEIPDEDAEGIATVGDVIAYIKMRVTEQE